MSELNSYELSRNWFDWCFENTDIVKPIHTALYFFAIEHCNRLGWKDKFGLPTQMTMDAIGVKNWRTYSTAFEDIVKWGFFDVKERSKNQYSATVIAIVKNTKANTKALSKAMQKHSQKHSQKQSSSIVVIDKPINQEPINNIIVFDVFWEAYNKKVGDKSKCEKKWYKLSEETKSKILETIPAFVSQFSDKQYQPFPETYLNQERWNDELKTLKEVKQSPKLDYT